MPLVRPKPPGTAAEPLLPTVIAVLVESKVPIELEHVMFVQTWKVILPVSFVSGSLKVAVNVGVVVLSSAPAVGVTSTGVDGATFVVLFVIEAFVSVAVTAAFPVVCADVAHHRVRARLRVGERECVQVVDGACEREAGLVRGRVGDVAGAGDAAAAVGCQ